jgi:UDP-N-acetyl-D-mannosaminuronic acid dehydrogenase
VRQNFKTISVIGLGYIGLPTAAVLASRKINVIGVDVNQVVVDTINRGEIHIVEPDLDLVVKAVVREGYLRATTLPEPADAFLIAVPTPFRDGHAEIPFPDMNYIEAATKSIAPVLKAGDIVILESTSPVGTTEQMAAWFAEARPDLSFPQTHGELSDVRIAHCPERVLPGQVLRELVQNDRVIGGLTPKCSNLAENLYSLFVQGECVLTTARMAEMCKLTENSFRDLNIAFANELSIISDKLDINVWELIHLANRHPRVNILQPGPGVGGHCIAVDPWFIISAVPKEARLIRTARQINDSKPDWVIDKVKFVISDYMKHYPAKTAKEIRIACFGLSFKADIDDLRESPALDIVKNLSNDTLCEIIVIEPNINELPTTLRQRGIRLLSVDMAIHRADIALILVDHKQFKDIAWSQFFNFIVDTKGISINS